MIPPRSLFQTPPPPRRRNTHPQPRQRNNANRLTGSVLNRPPPPPRYSIRNNPAPGQQQQQQQRYIAPHPPLSPPPPSPPSPSDSTPPSSPSCNWSPLPEGVAFSPPVPLPPADCCLPSYLPARHLPLRPPPPPPPPTPLPPLYNPHQAPPPPVYNRYQPPSSPVRRFQFSNTWISPPFPHPSLTTIPAPSSASVSSYTLYTQPESTSYKPNAANPDPFDMVSAMTPLSFASPPPSSHPASSSGTSRTKRNRLQCQDAAKNQRGKET